MSSRMWKRLLAVWPKLPARRSAAVVVGVHERTLLHPGVAVIVFAAGAEMAGESLAVDVNLLIAFAPPAADRIDHVQASRRQTGPWPLHSR